MLPAATSRDGVTIVVVPLISLREDLKNRCQKAGINCAEWDGKRPPFWARIQLVVPEAAISETFGNFIDENRSLRQLDRMVIDECHVALDFQDRWRPALLKFIEYTEEQTQLMYLTATLPPKDETRFYEVIGLIESEVF